jgi:hypothetical protein
MQVRDPKFAVNDLKMNLGNIEAINYCISYAQTMDSALKVGNKDFEFLDYLYSNDFESNPRAFLKNNMARIFLPVQAAFTPGEPEKLGKRAVLSEAERYGFKEELFLKLKDPAAVITKDEVEIIRQAIILTSVFFTQQSLYYHGIKDETDRIIGTTPEDSQPSLLLELNNSTYPFSKKHVLYGMMGDVLKSLRQIDLTMEILTSRRFVAPLEKIIVNEAPQEIKLNTLSKHIATAVQGSSCSNELKEIGYKLINDISYYSKDSELGIFKEVAIVAIRVFNSPHSEKNKEDCLKISEKLKEGQQNIAAIKVGETLIAISGAMEIKELSRSNTVPTLFNPATPNPGPKENETSPKFTPAKSK